MVISGNYLLYCEDDGMMDPTTKTWDSVYCVYLYNMHDGTTSSIKSNIGKPIDIRMDGNYVVWTTQDGDGSDILLFDIQSHPLKIITIAQGGNNNHARISGNKIVYHSDKGDAHHIYIYNIPTGTDLQMTLDSKQMSADISGNTIVFDDNRDGNWNIYTYDLTTHLAHYFTYENMTSSARSFTAATSPTWTIVTRKVTVAKATFTRWTYRDPGAGNFLRPRR